MHIACQEGLFLVVKYILKKFPELSKTTTGAKWTPLMIACEAGHEEIIELIISKKPALLYDYASESGTPLHAAISGKKPEVSVKVLIEQFDEDNRTVEMVNKKDLSGIHPLFLSSFTGNLEITQLLIESGSDPAQASNESNATPLHICAERGFDEMSELLLDILPDLLWQKEDIDGNTPLHVACEWDQLECVRQYCDVLDT